MCGKTKSLKTQVEEKLFKVQRKPYKHCHIHLKSELICRECKTHICTNICPALVYECNEGTSTVNIQHENCLECGTCQIACELQNIVWTNPTEGTGITYKNS